MLEQYNAQDDMGGVDQESYAYMEAMLRQSGISQEAGGDVNTKDVVEFLLNLPQNQDVIEAQLDRWSAALPGHKHWADTARTCQKFLEGEQWTPEKIAQFASEGLPHVTLNHIKPLVFLVLGFYRQNRYETRLFPASDSQSAADVADLLTATLKQIHESNNSAWIDSQVFQDGIVTGRAFWDNRLDFENNKLGEVRETSEDPFSVIIDPEAEAYDPASQNMGWGYVMKTRWMSPRELFLLYGVRAATNVLTMDKFEPVIGGTYREEFNEAYYNSKTFGLNILEDRWNTQNETMPQSHINRDKRLVRVLECQHVQLKLVKSLSDPVTGQEIILDSTVDREKVQRLLEFAQLAGMPEVRVEQSLRRMVRWTVTAADRLLYDEWSPYGKHMTITPYFPYFRRGVTRGMVHDLIEPQREINQRRSARLHAVVTAVNGGWMYQKGALDDLNKQVLEQMGSTPGVIIEYQPQQPPPVRIESSPTPYAQKELELDTAQDLKYIANINDSALGNIDKVQSGRAIQARQQQALVGTEIYFDNFRYSRELKARVQLAIIQKYYTEERLIRLRGQDNKSEEYTINQRDAAGRILNDISVGTYDVTVDEQPSSAAHLQSQFNELFDMYQAQVPIPADILIKYSSLPDKQEIVRRMQEERDIQMQGALMENIIQRLQAGIPMDQPLPPIVVNGKEMPNVITPEMLQQVMQSLQATNMQGQQPQQQQQQGVK